MQVTKLLLLSLAPIALAACGDTSAAGSRPDGPDDVRGTFTTAARLTLGACGYVNADEQAAGVTIVLNSDGLCVTSEEAAETCERYDDLEVDIDGFKLERTETGGWSDVALFEHADGTPAYGCGSPKFEVPCSDTECAARELFSHGGPQLITFRMGGETRTITATDWLSLQHIEVESGHLIPGKRATVHVAPAPAPVKGGLSFDFDDNHLNTVWCATTPLGQGLTDGGSCTSWGIGDVAPEDWTSDGFTFIVPPKLPLGTGRFGFSTDAEVAIDACPFGKCKVTAGRSAETVAVVGP